MYVSDPNPFPTFFLVVAPKSFIPRDSGIEELQRVLRDVLVRKNLVVADDFCQRERLQHFLSVRLHGVDDHFI